jgi:hypothetical protein
MDQIKPIESLAGIERAVTTGWRPEHPWPLTPPARA